LYGEDWDEYERIIREDTDESDLWMEMGWFLERTVVGIGHQEFWDVISHALEGFEPDPDERSTLTAYMVQLLTDREEGSLTNNLFSDRLYADALLYEIEQEREDEEGLMGHELPSTEAILYMRGWWLANGGSHNCEVCAT
jgi:hypothetical protein